VPGGRLRKLAIGWLLLAVGSLVVVGLFTVLIVLSRTSGLQDIFPWTDFFHTALVVHVDLTVLVWFLAFAGVLWSIGSTEQCVACGWVALCLAITGAVIISIAPFLGAGDPLKNNYVPVLRDPVFFYGLGIFGLGFAILVLRGLLYSPPMNKTMSGEGALRFGLYTALLAALLAILAVVWSYSAIPVTTEGEQYYEVLFWGGGHVLQFTHTQLMLVVWLWLATASGMAARLSPRVAVLFLALGFAPTLLTPVIYLSYDIMSPSHSVAFLLLMKYGGGLAALPLGLAVVIGVVRGIRDASGYNALHGALVFSILLFGIGGVIGFMIGASNVTVPAHYHGSIVGVTLAYMGLTYHLLPRLGFRNPVGRMVNWQPLVYGGGQLLHVLGLAWSGGYGVQRKTAGAAQGLDSIQEIVGMGMMGFGGLIAIAGGVMFLVVVFLAIRPEN
jgi:hypothetical protein